MLRVYLFHAILSNYFGLGLLMPFFFVFLFLIFLIKILGKDIFDVDLSSDSSEPIFPLVSFHNALIFPLDDVLLVVFTFANFNNYKYNIENTP